MLSDKIKKILLDLKECPSNLSQDSIRIQYNENFRKLREILADILSDVQNQNNIVQNLNIIFPSAPDKRLQYVLKYDDSIEKWILVKWIGTQNTLEDGEAVEIGNKHQHIVAGSMNIDAGAEVIINAGGELVIIPPVV